MKTDPKSALQLLDKILTNEIEILSKEEADFLLENKEICTRKLLPILALEITQIKEEDPWNTNNLYGSLKLLAFFEEKKAFDWLIQLHEYPEVLENEEHYFILLFWADILVATISSDWSQLKKTIENPGASEAIREACIDALLILITTGLIDRSLVVEYFQSLYSKNISGEIYDPELILLILEASLALWPGESIDNIREIFGLDLVDETFITLPELLTAFEQGKESCLEHLTSWTTHSHLLEFFIEEPSSSYEDIETSLQENSSDSDSGDEIELEEESSDYEYDCEDDLESFENITNEIPTPLFCLKISSLSQKDQKRYKSLPKLLVEDPEEALDIASELIVKAPESPSILYYFYSSLATLEAKVLALNVLKEWVVKFPDDLLGKIEYAHYFLRRREPEEVEKIFNNTWSLTLLYPQKASFHELECLKFFHVIGFYFLQIDDMTRAQEQLQILDTTHPNSFEYFHLKREIDLYLQRDLFNEES